MSKQLQKSLSTLIDLRNRELEKRQADLIQKRALCTRVEGNIERLDQLYFSVSSSDTMSASLALNTAAYKQAVLQLVDTQRKDLQLKKADVGQAQAAVNAAAIKHEVLGQVLQKSLTRSFSVAEKQTQKAQDDLASQVWMRGQA